MSRPTILDREDKPVDRFQYISSFRLEIVCLAILFGLFLLFNIATYYVYPTVEYDEVFFTDPAANLHFGKGFTSTVFEFQTKDKFWVGNAPLYSILLANWMNLVGFSILSARSLNYALTIIWAIMLWLATIRLNLVTSSWTRVSLIGILLLTDAVSYNYRTGRYDALTILLCVACLLACSFPYSWLRCVLLACISIFLPMAGIHMAAYIPLMCGLLLVYLRRSFIRESISIVIGAIVGVIFMYLLYFTNGVWFNFLMSAMGTRHSVTGKLGQAIILHKTNHLAEYTDFLVYFRESSFPLLLALAIGIAVYRFQKNQFKFMSLLSFGLAAGLVIPVGVFLLGQYPIYYAWMALIPLTICIFSVLNPAQFNYKKWTHWLVIGVLVLSCLVGLPRRLALAYSQGAFTDDTAVEALVKRNVTKDDWVFCDYSAYYAVKKIASVAILPSYARAPSLGFAKVPEEEKLTVLIISPSRLEKFASRLSGDWKPTGDGIDSNIDTYKLQVYRRNKTA